MVQIFFIARSFWVKIDQALSKSHSAPTGVSWGSLLSPLLYIILMSDIRFYIPKEVKYLVYADDLKIYSPNKSVESQSALQQAINGVVAWCQVNGMLLSQTKCTVLNYNLRGVEYELDNNVLPTSEVTRDLGIHMSPSLDFSVHIHKTITSASILINTIFRCFIIRSPSMYIHLYKSLILSRFLYCSPVWTPYLKKHRTALDGVHRKFIRRLRWRCGQNCDISAVPSITSCMDINDKRTLSLLFSCDSFHYFFNVTSNDLRSRWTISPKTLARSELINNQFSWRMSKWFHVYGVPNELHSMLQLLP